MELASAKQMLYIVSVVIVDMDTTKQQMTNVWIANAGQGQNHHLVQIKQENVIANPTISQRTKNVLNATVSMLTKMKMVVVHIVDVI